MVGRTNRRSSRSVTARGGATKQSTAVQDGLDCFASVAGTETGIGSYRRDLALGRALAGPCPAWQGHVPVFGVVIQPASCFFLALNRKSTRIFARRSIFDSGHFSKSLCRRS